MSNLKPEHKLTPLTAVNAVVQNTFKSRRGIIPDSGFYELAKKALPKNSRTIFI